MALTKRVEDMRTAIAKVFADEGKHTSDRGIITNFIIIVEVIGDDGEPYLKRMSDETPLWRQVGMLTAISDDLRAVMQSNDES